MGVHFSQIVCRLHTLQPVRGITCNSKADRLGTWKEISADGGPTKPARL
jgi:hypothetical protein